MYQPLGETKVEPGHEDDVDKQDTVSDTPIDDMGGWKLISLSSDGDLDPDEKNNLVGGWLEQ